MKNSIFDIFKPKENKFFPLLSGMTETTLTAANLIVECVQTNDHAEIVEFYKKIKEQERACDKIQNKIFDELNATFITPFDREDINALSSKLDDVTDLITSCVKRIMLYKPKTMPESAYRLALLVKEAAELQVKAIDELNILKKSPARIIEFCDQIHIIEGKADDVYEHFLIDLFENEKDAMEVMKLKEILHELERATDASEAVCKIIKMIIIKYT